MNSTKSKPSLIKISFFIAAVALLILSFVIFSLNFVSIDGNLYNLSSTELDFSNTDLDDYSVFKRFSRLETLDLRGSDIQAEELSELCEELDGCNILWSVTIGNQVFSHDSSVIKLDSAEAVTAQQLAALPYMKNLTSFDISGSGADYETAVKLNQLSESMPYCNFTWDIDLGGILFPHDSTEIIIPAATTADEYQKLLLFCSLTRIDASAVGFSEELNTIAQQVSIGEFVWTVSLAGVEVLSTAQEADISGHIVNDLAAFSESLKGLPSLKKLVMCDCGLTNEQMEQLIADYPGIKFVWTISFARWTGIRTDITCFSSLNHSTQLYDEETLAPLFKYCTDLVALDLGHSSIKDISMISNLTKLQALILGDNDITDISPLGALKDLEYLELWKNDFTDISVLTTLPNLKDLNLAYCNDIEDFEPLFSLPSIEMIWLQNSDFPKDLPERLEAKYPDCMFSFYKYNSSHGNGWCAQDRYLGIRQAFKNWQNVVCYTSWDNVIYKEGVKIYPAIRKWD